MSTPEYSPDELTELLSGLMPDIPGHRVMRLIGRGGMSYVYLGVQESLDRQVAIKVIRPDALKDEVSKLRFEKEARTIAKLQHPCIVGIYEVGRTDEGLLYYVMPFLSRGHVGQRDLTSDEPRVIEVLRAMLWALDYAHVRGIVHRDVKAENVLFDNGDRPVLADFGIAISKRDRARITGTGQAVGSSPHMAPEQARGERVDGRADLYSLGVLAYELLCGRLPFQNTDPLGMAVMHAVDPVPPLPADKQHWQAFVERALAKSPAARFADAHEMMAALDQVEAQSVQARARLAAPPVVPAAGRRAALPSMPTPPPLPRLPSLPALPRHWRVPLAVAAGVLTAGIALAWWWPGPGEPPAQPTLAAPAASAPAAPAAASVEALPPTAQLAPVQPEAETPATGDALLALEPPAAPVPVLPPGERELAAARQQIQRRRLTQPAGDNALESLRAARLVLPKAPALGELGERWLQAATPYLVDALANGRGDAARALFGHAAALADELRLREGAAWPPIERAVVAPLAARLQAALAAGDAAALRAAKAEIADWRLAPALFEPAWSTPIVTARVGDRIGGGMILVRLPTAERAGLAMMASAVSRADYAAFAAASGRAAASCRIRTARVTLVKRSWSKPGFEQADGQPVLCVSIADAEAFAAWRGARDGVRYRLPTAAEWQAHAGTGAVVVAAPGPQGRVREWPGGCGAQCRAVGTGWRDAEARASARGNAALDAAIGYDDVGFRLVRAVAFDEVAAR